MVASPSRPRPALSRQAGWAWAAAALVAAPTVIRALLDASVLQLAPVLPQAAVAAPLAPPKRPRNAYMLFAGERRGGYAGSGLKITEISKVLGEEWRKLTAKARKPWEAEAAKDKARYEKELKAFEDAGNELPKRSGKKAKASDPSKPKAKRAPSAYNLFQKERYPVLAEEAGEGAGIGEISRKIGQEWKSLTARKKAKWVKAAADLKASVNAEG